MTCSRLNNLYHPRPPPYFLLPKPETPQEQTPLPTHSSSWPGTVRAQDIPRELRTAGKTQASARPQEKGSKMTEMAIHPGLREQTCARCPPGQLSQGDAFT